MDILNDLKDRIFGYLQSSIAGGLLVVYAFLSDHGVHLSEENKTTITMKALAVLLGLWNIFRREGKPEPPQPESGSSGGSGSKSFLVILTLMLLLPLSSAGCYLSGKTAKHKIAIASDNAITALDAETSAVEILKAVGKLSDGASKQVHRIDQQVLEVIDIVRSRAEVGYDKQALLDKISITLKDIAEAESRGVAGIGDESDRIRFQDFVWSVRFGLETLAEIIRSGQEPEIPAEVARRLSRGSSPRAMAAYINELIVLARDTYFALYRQTKLTEPAAFEDGRARTVALRTRLIELVGPIQPTPAE